MRTLFLILVFIALIIMAIPAIFMYKVIRKSLKKPNTAELLAEKEQMKAWLYAKRNLLQPWNDNSISQINNNLQYFKKKWTARQAEGIMNTFDNIPLVAFKFIERGMTEDGHLYAISSSFDLYVRYVPEVKEFYLNDKLMGKIHRSGSIINAKGNIIGNAFRFSDKNEYEVVMGNTKVATIFKAKYLDKRLKRFSYDRHRPITKYNKPYYEKEIVPRYNIVQFTGNAITEEEREWVMAIGMFEAIYNSIYIV